MTLARVPTSTYRIQFSLGFRFVDARELIPYLHELGISDLYASPRFRARRGSSHGYDVADPFRVNSELGTDLEFEELAERLKLYRMGLLLDIVPNHMAASSDNRWWLDVLENGPSSRFASYFDIDWHPSVTKAAFLKEQRILLPILGDLFGNVLENQELTLKQDEDGFFIRYFDNRLPLDPKTYPLILEPALKALAAALGAGHSACSEMSRLIGKIELLPSRNSTDAEDVEKRRKQIGPIKSELWRMRQAHPETEKSLDETLHAFNGAKGTSESFDRLDSLLSRQAYRLAFWKLAAEEINYRRFFDISELVGLRVEDPQVFDASHAQIVQLIKDGKVTGLRVDHVDGLYDPVVYLCRLQSAAHGSKSAAPAETACNNGTQRFFVVVEKVLTPGETLRKEWPVSGTTGYDFLNLANGLFIQPEGLQALQRISSRFAGLREEFPEVTYKSRKQVLQELFAGEVNTLAQALGRLAAHDRRACDVPLSELRQAIIEVTACLPVYRTYIRSAEVPESDRRIIEDALQLAARRAPRNVVGPPAFAFLRSVLLLERAASDTAAPSHLEFVMNWQQLTGAVMAKGVEDTAFYRYFTLISLNEVGGNPGGCATSLEEFHSAMQFRQENMPCTLNATSTHDTKRSEDFRARVNVLSEFHERWRKALKTWHGWNYTADHSGSAGLAPDPNDEILFYQTLLGAWPVHEEEIPAFRDRLRDYMLKAVREAKVHTSWLDPNTVYEGRISHLVELLDRPPDENSFLRDCRRFQATLAPFGALNSLAQVLLKITAPGVPDFYQGSELWDFSLVDPDNRRPVDFKHRVEVLEESRRAASANLPELILELLANWPDGRIKFFVTDRALDFRMANPDLFVKGEYIPVEVRGTRKNHICVFARRLEGVWSLTVVPRLVTQFTPAGTFPLGSQAWKGTYLLMPRSFPKDWVDVLTGNVRGAISKNRMRVLYLRDVLGSFPLALLTSPPPA